MVSWDYILARVTPEPNSGCWLWTSLCSRSGYATACTNPKIYVKGETLRIHRIVYEMMHGPIPSHLFVCHKCDVRCCVNPDHLWVGTHNENMADMSRKGRASRKVIRFGESSPSSKLTDEKVLEIRARAANGETRRSLGAEFGVRKSVIDRIVYRQKWKHI